MSLKSSDSQFEGTLAEITSLLRGNSTTYAKTLFKNLPQTCYQ